MNKDYTAGPWYSEGCFIKAKAETGILQLGSTLSVNYCYGAKGLEVSDLLPQCENARLIAASPDLAEACLLLVECWDKYDADDVFKWTPAELDVVREQARAALRKAGVLE